MDVHTLFSFQVDFFFVKSGGIMEHILWAFYFYEIRASFCGLCGTGDGAIF